MTLKKTISSYKLPSGEWTKQIDIDMGPLEESATLAWWAVGDHLKIEPKKLSMEERILAFSDPLKGTEWVSMQDSNYDSNYKDWKTKHDQLIEHAKSKDEEYYKEISSFPKGTQTC